MSDSFILMGHVTVISEVFMSHVTVVKESCHSHRTETWLNWYLSHDSFIWRNHSLMTVAWLSNVQSLIWRQSHGWVTWIPHQWLWHNAVMPLIHDCDTTHEHLPNGWDMTHQYLPWIPHQWLWHNAVMPLKNGEIALWLNTRVVKCKYCVSQKRYEANDKIQWYNVLLTFIF